MKQGRTVLRILAAMSFLGPYLSQAQSPPSSSTALKVVYQFAADAFPAGNLVQGSDGSLYGVTTGGGTYSQGSVFKIDSGGHLGTLYSFFSDPRAVTSPDGVYPQTGLIWGADGNLYGTTSSGGSNSNGTLFKITPAGRLTTVFQFGNNSPPALGQSIAPLYLSSDGNIYGLSYFGGTNGDGALFRLSPSGQVADIHDFAYSEGSWPEGRVITTPDGTIYGTMSNSAASNHFGFWGGSIFKLTVDGTFTVLHYFQDPSWDIHSGLTLGPDGSDGPLYGTSVDSQNVFAITPDGQFSVVHQFDANSEGTSPVGALTLASDGNFYGVTRSGGPSNGGTLFQMTPQGVVTVVHAFGGPEGDSPASPLIEGTDGRLYGVTGHNPTAYSFALVPTARLATVAAVATDGAVNLTWNAVKGLDTYNIYQGRSSGGEGVTPVLTGVTGTTATVSGLQNGTQYYFQVAAANEAGAGPLSAEATALPIAAPKDLSAKAADGSVSLSWSAAAGAASYNIYEGDGAGGEATGPIATGITSTSTSVTGLANGKTYYFKVASVNGSTEVPSSAEVSATPNGPVASSGSSGGGSAGGGGGLMDECTLLVLGWLVLGLSRGHAGRSGRA